MVQGSRVLGFRDLRAEGILGLGTFYLKKLQGWEVGDLGISVLCGWILRFSSPLEAPAQVPLEAPLRKSSPFSSFPSSPFSSLRCSFPPHSALWTFLKFEFEKLRDQQVPGTLRVPKEEIYMGVSLQGFLKLPLPS